MRDFLFLKKNYEYHLIVVVNHVGDDAHIDFHIQVLLGTYLLYLVATIILVDKIATYVDVVSINYFICFEEINKYNWEHFV